MNIFVCKLQSKDVKRRHCEVEPNEMRDERNMWLPATLTTAAGAHGVIASRSIKICA